MPKSDQGVNEQDELRRLREENARLKELLTRHGISWEEPITTESVPAPAELTPVPTHFTTDDKIALFRRLFRGREDVYSQRWESAKGTSGYSPACGNEWKPGVCHKPRVKCGDCNQRQLLPVTDQVVYDHLAGKQTIGVYPLLSDDSCYFLAADFDEADWQEDAKAFTQSCREHGIPAALEISRSGNGAHAWIFFAEPVPAREARQLGAALISHTCYRTRQLSLASYDRLFPNQDTMPKGGFSNLIALPLQNSRGNQGAVSSSMNTCNLIPINGPFWLPSVPCPGGTWKTPFCGPAAAAIPWMWPLPLRKKTASHGSDHRLYPPGLQVLCRNR